MGKTQKEGYVYKNIGKRVLDFVFAIVAIVALAPLMFLIALVSLIVDPGPVLFCQKRVGCWGDLFNIYKFRSMPVGTKNTASDKLGTIRLFWWGRLLRRSNLDELPQLFNILKGDMSIVGPRPPLPEQEELILLRKNNGSLECRPGLTGLAQVNSYNGMAVKEKARFDGIYAANITLKKDFIILLRTLLYLAKQPPIY